MRRLGFITILLLAAGGSNGQGLVGVTWEPPAVGAEAELLAIAEAGFRTVRVPVGVGDGIMALADTLGMSVYQELDLRFTTTSELADTLSWARGAIDTASAEGAAMVGLAYVPQSSDPETCRLLAGLTGYSPVPTYLVSLTTPPDPCSGSVGAVFYDSPGHRNWVPGGGLIAGVAADGGAPHDQAAALIRHLGQDPAVLVHRWKDQQSAVSFVAEPGNARFGLVDGQGGLRPAGAVVRGYLVEGREAFDRPAPQTAVRPPASPLVVGWLVVIVLVIMAARSPRFMPVTTRYFRSHAFYRGGVAEGREQFPVTLVVLGIAVVVTAGLLIGQAARVFPASRIYLALWNWAPGPVRAWADWSTASQIRLILMFSTIWTITQAGWVLIVHGLARSSARLRITQTITAVVWPQWSTIVFLPLLMVVSGVQEEAARIPILTMTAAWMLATGWAGLRSALDLAAISRAGPLVTVAMLLLSLPCVIAIAIGFVWIRYSEAASYLIALASG